jgi:hypothetical protein
MMLVMQQCFIVVIKEEGILTGNIYMLDRKLNARLTGALAFLLLFAASISTALADQVTLSYIDAGTGAQTLTVDANSSSADLALAAALLGEEGVGVSHDPNNGSGSLADIAAAMAAAAPLHAASIAETLAGLSPGSKDDIVAAVNAVPGVNAKAVLAAVHFGDPGRNVGPQSIGSDSAISLELTEIETLSSPN